MLHELKSLRKLITQIEIYYLDMNNKKTFFWFFISL